MGITGIIVEVMAKCNNWGKTVMVTARLINGLICTDRTKICTAPTVKEIKLA